MRVLIRAATARGLPPLGVCLFVIFRRGALGGQEEDGSSGRHQQIDERLDVIAVRRTVAIDVRQAEGGVLVAE